MPLSLSSSSCQRNLSLSRCPASHHQPSMGPNSAGGSRNACARAFLVDLNNVPFVPAVLDTIPVQNIPVSQGYVKAPQCAHAGVVRPRLRRGATKTVGFNLRDISNPLFADLVTGAGSYLNSAGYSLLLMNSDQDPQLDVGHIKLFRQRRVDGLILSLQSETQPGLKELIASLKFPVVLVDRELEGMRLSSVVVDNYSGMHHAVQHLINLGHRRIALITGSEDILTTRERLRGYRAALQANDLAEEPGLLRLKSYDQ